MHDLLIKLKLIDYLKMTLPISKIDFVNRLLTITELGDVGVFPNQWEIFSSSDYDYKGQVNYDGFEIRKKQRLFSPNFGNIVAKGTFSETGGQLEIETEIDGFQGIYLIFFFFLLIFYTIIIYGFFADDSKAEPYLLIFFLLHGTFMFFIPFITMRVGVSRFKRELEREFYFLTGKKNN